MLHLKKTILIWSIKLSLMHVIIIIIIVIVPMRSPYAFYPGVALR